MLSRKLRYLLIALPVTSIVTQLGWGQASVQTPPPSTIQLTGRLVEGVRQVGGAAPNTAAATIRIRDADSTVPNIYLPLQDGSNSAAVNSTTHAFTATLAYALYAGQKIQLQQFDAMGMPVNEQASDPITIPGLADWGRWHMDVAAGAVLSFDNGFTSGTLSGNNSQSTLFLSLNVEKNWKWTGIRDISAPAPATSSPLPPAVVNRPYRVQLAVRFPSAILPLQFSLSGAPAWLNIDGSSGVLSGTPSMPDPAGTTFTTNVADSSGSNPISLSSRIRVVDVPEVLLSSRTQLPPAVRGQDYDYQLEINLGGFTAPVTFAFSPPNLVPWLTLNSNGRLHADLGNLPAAGGPFNLAISLMDAAGQKSSFSASIEVVDSPPAAPAMMVSIGTSAPENGAFRIFQRGRERSRKTSELNSRWGFTTYFQGRLTSIPVTICQAMTTTTPTMATMQTTQTTPAAGGSGNQGTTPCSSDTLSTFLTSTKSGEILGGAYLPILLPVWTSNMAPNALFIAPIAKVGFATPTGSTGSSAPVSTSTTTTDMGTTTTAIVTQPVNASQFYNFYSFGGRLGHFKLSRDSSSAPELLSYLDVSVGRFSNLDTLVPAFDCKTDNSALQPMTTCTALRNPPPAGQSIGPLIGVPVRRWRINIEGLLKIPSTPFAVGMSANIGQNLFTPPLSCGSNCPSGIPTTLQGPKDDLRFFIGAKFDLGKMLAKLTPL
jgi:hypothetical protein